MEQGLENERRCEVSAAQDTQGRALSCSSYCITKASTGVASSLQKSVLAKSCLNGFFTPTNDEPNCLHNCTKVCNALPQTECAAHSANACKCIWL